MHRAHSVLNGHNALGAIKGTITLTRWARWIETDVRLCGARTESQVDHTRACVRALNIPRRLGGAQTNNAHVFVTVAVTSKGVRPFLVNVWRGARVCAAARASQIFAAGPPPMRTRRLKSLCS